MILEVKWTIYIGHKYIHLQAVPNKTSMTWATEEFSHAET